VILPSINPIFVSISTSSIWNSKSALLLCREIVRSISNAKPSIDIEGLPKVFNVVTGAIEEGDEEDDDIGV